MRRPALYFMVFTLLTSVPLSADECRMPGSEHWTHDFHFMVSSAQGAPGEIVAIDVSLTVDSRSPEEGLADLFAFPLGWDATRVHWVGEEYAESIGIPWLVRLSDPSASGLTGLIFTGKLLDELPTALASGETVHVMTFLFRLTGEIGSEISVSTPANDFVNRTNTCESPWLTFEERSFAVYSDVHYPGTITIVEGTPGEDPDLPPEAESYDPSVAEGAEAHFELAGSEGSDVAAGAEEVPVDLYITSDLEFVGFTATGTYPSSALTLTRIEEVQGTGAVGIDAEAGGFWISSPGTLRRLGSEGERRRVATLYFDVSQSLAPGTELEVTLDSWRGSRASNWVHILGNNLAGGLPVTTEVEPLEVTPALLRVEAARARMGDVNVDRLLNITDAVVLLGDLFLGTEQVECWEAADVNEDSEVNLSDPVAILNHLFLSGPLASGEALCSGG